MLSLNRAMHSCLLVTARSVLLLVVCMLCLLTRSPPGLSYSSLFVCCAYWHVLVTDFCCFKIADVYYLCIVEHDSLSTWFFCDCYNLDPHTDGLWSVGATHLQQLHRCTPGWRAHLVSTLNELFNQVCNDEDVAGDWCHLYEGFVISCVNGLCRYIFVYYHVTAIVWCTTWFHWRPAMCSCLSCISICHAILNQWQLPSTKCCQTASLCWYATSYDLHLKWFIHCLSVCLSVCMSVCLLLPLWDICKWIYIKLWSLKLDHCGWRGLSLDWFASYLTNCYQYDEDRDIKSSFLHITCGVPQCSVLGPGLFLV